MRLDRQGKHRCCPKATTALLEQGRHLSMKGGERHVAYQRALPSCNPLALPVDCCSVPPERVEQKPVSGGVEPTGNHFQCTIIRIITIEKFSVTPGRQSVLEGKSAAHGQSTERKNSVVLHRCYRPEVDETWVSHPRRVLVFAARVGFVDRATLFFTRAMVPKGPWCERSESVSRCDR